MTALARITTEPAAPWVQTHSGRAFPLIEPHPADVYWPDIIYALAHLNRFSGHAGSYSVAQHSALVAEQLPPEWKLYGLLHDAHEATIGDITTPVSRALQILGDGCEGYPGRVHRAIRQLKDGVDAAIYPAAGLDWPIPQTIEEAVHIADKRAFVTEVRDLLGRSNKSLGPEYERLVPLSESIIAWDAGKATACFASALRVAGLQFYLPVM